MRTENELREDLLLALRILYCEGLFEHTAGHVSCRIPDTEQVLISGHIHPKGRTIDSISPEDFTVVDLEGNKLRGELGAPGERYIHLEIYKRRADVGAVVHAHPQISVSLSIADQEILPVFHRGTIFAPKVPVFDYPGQVDTPELGARLAETLGRAVACMIRAHGCVCVGKDIRHACVAALMLENNALHQMRVLQMGRQVRPIEPQYIRNGIIAGLEEEEYYSNPWAYYASKVRGTC